MIYLLLISLAGIILGGILGYFLGRYQSALLARIEELKVAHSEPPKQLPKPTVTMGEYTPSSERVIGSDDPKRSAGLVETKTPELLEWENRDKINKEALGR